MLYDHVWMGKYVTHNGNNFCNPCSRMGALGDIIDPEQSLMHFYLIIEINDELDNYDSFESAEIDLGTLQRNKTTIRRL